MSRTHWHKLAEIAQTAAHWSAQYRNFLLNQGLARFEQ